MTNAHAALTTSGGMASPSKPSNAIRNFVINLSVLLVRISNVVRYIITLQDRVGIELALRGQLVMSRRVPGHAVAGDYSQFPELY